MVRNVYLAFLLILALSITGLAQTGSGTLRGVIKDLKTGETIPFANVVLESGGIQLGSGQSNINGEYTIKPIDPGTYEAKVSFVGYKPVKITGVLISGGKITTVDVKMESSIVEIKTFEVVEYEVPLIDDKQGKTLTKEEIYALPTRNINSVAATTAGVTQADEGSSINIRGSRDDATFYFVDGIKVRGGTNIPQQGIEQITVITGGIPAMFGDATGGVISITTRGPSQKVAGGLEYVRSVDGFGYNLLGFNITGPIATRKMEDGTKKPYIGFFLSSELAAIADNSPSAIGILRMNEDRLQDLIQNPLRPGPIGVGNVANASFIRTPDFENVKRKENTGQQRASIAGKIDFKLNESMNLTVGGTFEYNNRRQYSFANTMFNSENNGRVQEQTSRGYVKFTQRLGAQGQDAQASAATIKNVFYTIQLDYTDYRFNRFNDRHRDNLFDYGYVGRFETQREPFYGFSVDTINGAITPGFYQLGFRDVGVKFTPSDKNPELANYTSQYYDLANGVTTGFTENIFQIIQGNALINGFTPPSVYSMYSAPGAQFGFTQKFDFTQLRVVGNASADIKGHEVSFGFEYEQRTDRGYTVSPIGLWNIMRQLSNRHIDQLDLSNPTAVFDANGLFTDTVTYNRLVNLSNQSNFDRALRQQLGLDVNGSDFIDIDALDPSTFNINMFSADELFNGGGGASLVSNMYGYDAYGNRIRGRRSLDDFFQNRDERGNFTREVGAFTPIYMAAYIQDKFAFRDLIFNIGLRVDRYDANQLVLSDPFSLFETRKAGEFNYSGNEGRPTNIGDDYVVYVRDINNTDLSDINNIVGYRNGTRWYNSGGVEVANPQSLAQASSTGQIAPALLDPSNQELSSRSFRDFKPQVNFMPRIAFQFPISDVAQFFAHYDVLTQRPTAGGLLDPVSRLNPIDYLFIANNIGNTLNNPDLQPQRTIDYEVGFKQALNQSSAITISAFYRELRNLIQVIPVNFAYPVNYTTFGNIDFGTVKGMSIAYDLRRTNNVRMGANYTLQFADGTGSSASTTQDANINAALIQAGFPNLRTTLPLNFDVRHQIQVTFDYHYGRDQFYNGPVLFGKKIFEDAGVNFTVLANSGTPYTRSSVFNPEGLSGVAGRPQLKGSLNGSRLPFQARINMRVEKNFELKLGKKKGTEEYRTTNVQAYCLIQNLLNRRNIISVYRATGNPDDDGFLSAPTSQGTILGALDPISFANLYVARINNPGNYSLPRIIRFGAIFNF